MASRPRTLYEKIWDTHVVEERPDGTSLVFIDRHLVHEVTSPQAFEALRLAGRKVRRPDLTLAVPDHNVPTTARRDAAGRGRRLRNRALPRRRSGPLSASRRSSQTLPRDTVSVLELAPPI